MNLHLNSITASLIQQMAYEDRQQSLEHTIQGIAEAARQGAQLILLQELHTGPYFCQTENIKNFDLAEPIPGPTTLQLAALAKTHRVVIVGSIFEQRAPGLYHNTAVVLDQDGTLAGIYRKMHIPHDPGFYEKYYFTPGDLGFTPIATSLGHLGILVCWDQWFPEAARIMALHGADLLLYPTAIGWCPQDSDATKHQIVDAWRTIQRSHSIANGLPVLSCNRVGYEPDPSGQLPGLQFFGNSFITNSQGKILAQADHETPTVLTATLDLREKEQVRREWPHFRDRRIDAYQTLLDRWKNPAIPSEL